MKRRASWHPVALASLLPLVAVTVACEGRQTVASRSAAAYDEAQRKGIPVQGGGGHSGAHAPASDHKEPGPGAVDEPHGPGSAHHAGGAEPGHSEPSRPAERAPTGHGGMTVMDHSHAV